MATFQAPRNRPSRGRQNHQAGTEQLKKQHHDLDMNSVDKLTDDLAEIHDEVQRIGELFLGSAEFGWVPPGIGHILSVISATCTLEPGVYRCVASLPSHAVVM